jgi:hypothetical protein
VPIELEIERGRELAYAVLSDGGQGYRDPHERKASEQCAAVSNDRRENIGYGRQDRKKQYQEEEEKKTNKRIQVKAQGNSHHVPDQIDVHPVLIHNSH